MSKIYWLGRNVNHDHRSREFAHVRRAIRPMSVLWPLDAPAMDQGAHAACTGFAAAQWLNCSAARANRTRFNRTQMRQLNLYVRGGHGMLLYRKATEEDDFGWTYPPNDYGSSGLGVAKALMKFGAIDRYEWTFSFEGFLSAAQRQPVLVGTEWTESMFSPDRNGIIRATSPFGLGGHEYLVRGINWPRKLIRIRNSWGTGWGIKGDAYIPFADMEKLLAAQGDCTVPIVV
jgi:hypothetical protein